MMHPYDSGSTLNFFLKFFTMKGVKRYMKINFSPQKNLWANGPILDPKMVCLHNSRSTREIFIFNLAQ